MSNIFVLFLFASACLIEVTGVYQKPAAAITPARMRKPASAMRPRDSQDRTHEMCEEIVTFGHDVLHELGFGFTAGEIRARVVARNNMGFGLGFE